jgi:uracil-DNA glycosylase
VNDHEKNNKQKLSDFVGFLKKQPAGFAYRDQAASKKRAAPVIQKTETAPALLTETNEQKLTALKCTYTDCQKCPLAKQGRKQVVFGDGNTQATLMFVGEGPGKDEDEQGRPFVGRAGVLLTSIIQAMNLERSQVYISNVVKCRPPANRVPTPDESSTCKDMLLYKEIEIIKPKIICTLGATATQALLGEDTKITKARGVFFEFKGTLVLPTYHPAYLLRNPAEKKTVWEDMQKIMAKLAELGA